MTDKLSSSSQPAAKVIRWGARVLSILIVGFWGFILMAGVVGGRPPQARPLNTYDYVMLILMAIWLIGLVLAWKWELAGATIVLVAFAANLFVNFSILLSPAIIVPITAVLFLFSWWLNRPRDQEESV